jgi:stringent starvation protein B
MMLSNRPYLLRAFYQWIIDSGCTPILVLDVNHPRCKVPLEYAEGGEIVFNISSEAVRDLKMTNEFVEFKASFSGVIHIISAHIKAVLAVYAEENGEGIFFDPEEEESESTAKVTPFKGIESLALVNPMETESMKQDVLAKAKSKSRPFLKLVE